jgi:hypothetical protein
MEHYVKKSQHVDLSQIKRGDWLGNNRKCHMLSCDIANKDAIVHDNEPLKFELQWESTKDIDNLYFRIQYRIFGDPVSSSFLEQPLTCKKGLNKVILSINVDNLVPNNYEAVFVLYEQTETGSSIDLDCIVAMMFERISDNVIYDNWNIAMWGKTKLGSIQIVEK